MQAEAQEQYENYFPKSNYTVPVFCWRNATEIAPKLMEPSGFTDLQIRLLEGIIGILCPRTLALITSHMLDLFARVADVDPGADQAWVPR